MSPEEERRKVEAADRFTVGGCEREGEPLDFVCRIQSVTDVKYVEPTIHEALLAYFGKHPVIAPKRDRRAVASDLPREVFSRPFRNTKTNSP